jgi:hypothetical protein
MLRQLLRMSPTSYLVNAMPLQQGNVDHIVIGRTGVFVIETGVARLGGGILSRNGHAPHRDPLRRVRRGAEAVREILRREGMDLPGVQAAICLPFASQERPRCRGGVLVARPWQLAYLIRHWHGQVLSATDAVRIFSVLRAHAPRVAA